MRRDALLAEILGSGLVVLACASSCGPSPPPEGDAGGEGGVTTEGDGDSAGDAGSVGTGSPTEPTTPDTDTTGGAPAVPGACALVRLAGDARVPLDATVIGAPRLWVLEPGAPGVPARVMTTQLESSGFSHANYRARRFTLDAWPEGVAETGAALRLTRDGHSISRLVELDGPPRRYAYVWTGDPRGQNLYDTFFSVLDADDWSVGGEVELEPGTNPLFVDLQPAASPARFVSTYTTDPEDSPPTDEISGYSLGVLDGAGTPVVGATALTLRTPHPGSEIRTFWAGDRVAVAMGHNGCRPDDELCVPHAVVLARPTAPDEHGAAASGFALASVIDGLAGTGYVSRPQITALSGLNFLIWYEGDDWVSSDEHRTFRGMVLDASGTPIPWPPDDPVPGARSFMDDTAMASWPNLLVSEFGVTVAYRTVDGTFEVHHHDFEFKPLGDPIALELESQPHFPAMAVLGEPRSLLLAWVEDVESEFSMRMVRLACDAG